MERTMPRWRRFCWQGGVLIAIGAIGDALGVVPGLAVLVAVIGVVVLFAGLVGAALARD